ncbi:MAG TPA: glycosyltransferase family 2 protein [Candidatus Olsenella excrementavium]|uniref:Glycosyltransferase family 2 protein n=1 Tax=Candidatus Olsenella excrementavium TaxID=2838709 RepID=A0A9D1ZAK7_9ACTN|nr:glycosyltransferase family 2 protein [Candidatus Olsenella excrementavium]
MRGSLCVVVPCHNEEESLPAFFERMDSVEPTLAEWVEGPVLYALVDDGSSDRTLEILRELHDRRPEVHYVSFSRNFGKEAGLAAGLRKAYDLGADFVAVMDADLQDPPELLAQMFSSISGGCDVAAAYRTSREGEPPIRSWFANRFYDVINRISDVEMKSGARDFRLMTRRAVHAILSLPERSRFSKGIFSWVGFETAWIPYENVEREHGSSSWSFFSLARYALDGIVAFSTVPLELISILGLLVCLVAMLFLVLVLVRALAFGDPVAGWPSLMCVILLLGGAILFGVGIVGLYLSKVYAEVKRRPLYVVSEEA